MLTKMRIQCSGQLPEPTNTIAFRMTDGTVRQITFDKVSVNTDNGTTLVFECEPQEFKPWRMEAILTQIPGLGEYTGISFTTERYFVILTDEMLEQMNKNICEVCPSMGFHGLTHSSMVK